MEPTILIAGATGNTGRGVVETLSKLKATNTNNPFLSNYRILALTRSLNSPSAKHVASLRGVSVMEKSWVEITPAWLRSQNITRAFIASRAETNQFAEESTFLVAALHAGVQYVVRISTTAANVHPDFRAYYPRTHWALETLLAAPEFRGLQWTSLQPNLFTNFYLASAAEFVREYRKTKKQDILLRLMASRDAPVGIVDPYEVGVFAARLLSLEDTGLQVHNGQRYVFNGPEDITGEEIVQLVEKHIGAKIEPEHLVYKDLSFLDDMVAATKESKNVISSMRYSAETAWDGKCTASTTSREVLELAPPIRTAAEVFEDMLGDQE